MLGLESHPPMEGCDWQRAVRKVFREGGEISSVLRHGKGVWLGGLVVLVLLLPLVEAGVVVERWCGGGRLYHSWLRLSPTQHREVVSTALLKRERGGEGFVNIGRTEGERRLLTLIRH